MGYFEDRIVALNVVNPDLAVPKIIIVQRLMPNRSDWHVTMRAALERGWIVVLERDDYPVTPVVKAAKIWEKSLKWQSFGAVHAVQVSTESLRQAFLPHNPETKVFENHLLKTPDYHSRTDTRTRLFFGALNRRESWATILPNINRLTEKYPDVEPVVLHDRDFFDGLASANKTFYPAQAYENYLACLASCDIALLPLHENEFTIHKSDIKFVEAGAGRTAVIASPTVYDKTIEHGKTGLIAHTADRWADYLEKLIVDEGYRKGLANNAHAYVLRNRMLVDHIHERVDWYYSLWERRNELTARLVERFPACKP